MKIARMHRLSLDIADRTCIQVLLQASAFWSSLHVMLSDNAYSIYCRHNRIRHHRMFGESVFAIKILILVFL